MIVAAAEPTLSLARRRWCPTAVTACVIGPGDECSSGSSQVSTVFRSAILVSYPEYLSSMLGFRRRFSRCTNLYNPRVQARILALDVGSRTLGLAVTDPLGITAQGLPTIRRKNRRADFAQLDSVVKKYDVKEFVVGYPLRLSGATGTQSEKMTVFAEQLRHRYDLPVHLWDERLTTAEAQRVLRESEMSVKRRSEVVDQLAAVLILQSFLESRQSK
jgi:putative holliday junction resolvase